MAFSQSEAEQNHAPAAPADHETSARKDGDDVYRMRRKKMSTRIAWAILSGFALAALPAPSIAELMGSRFTYQGSLTQGGGPVTGDTDMKFTLWDSAADGNQVGSTLTFDGQPGNPGPIAATSGLFTVKLDFGVLVFNGEARWLRIEVRFPHDPENTGAYTPLTPRQELTPTPYAIFALSAPLPAHDHPHDHFGQTWGGNDPQLGLGIQNFDAANVSYGLYAEALSNQGTGVVGWASSPNGPAYGVEGWSSSSQGIGVFGWARSAGDGSNLTYGVYGQSDASTGIGVMGHATAETGDTRGVYGRASSDAGIGVFGDAVANSGNTFGVYGQTASDAGVGVFGHAIDDAGETRGVYGKAASNDGIGVYGISTAETGDTYGVYGEASSSIGIGVGGYATHDNGINHGVDGKSLSCSQIAAGIRAQGNGVAGPGTPRAAALKIDNGAMTVTGGVRPAGTIAVTADNWQALASGKYPDENGHSHTIGWRKNVTLTNPLIIADQSIILLTMEGYVPGTQGWFAHVETKANGSATIRVTVVGQSQPANAGRLHYLIINPVLE